MDKCLYTTVMDVEDGFDWDNEKAVENHKKHGVRFNEALPVMDDPYAITISDDESDPTEQRFITLGVGELGRVLVVVHTFRLTGSGPTIRIISARVAQRHEQKEYEDQRL